MSKKATIADQVLELLSEGDKWADEIVAGVSAQPMSIRMRLGQLVKEGVIVRVKRGIYRKKEVLEVPGAAENPRKHLDNVKTINRLLNLCDKVLDAIALTIEIEDWMLVKSKWRMGVPRKRTPDKISLDRDFMNAAETG